MRVVDVVQSRMHQALKNQEGSGCCTIKNALGIAESRMQGTLQNQKFSGHCRIRNAVNVAKSGDTVDVAESGMQWPL